MSTEQYANNAQTTLNGPINNSTTTIVVASAAGFPSSPQFRIGIDSELLLVTAGAGTTTWTVTRGIEGTTAAAHGNGIAVTQVLTAGGLENLDASYIGSGELGVARGGTGADLSATGGSGQYVKQPSSGASLSVGTIPASDVPNLDAAKITTGTLPIARGGTNSATALGNNRIMESSGGAVVEGPALTNGQLLIGNTGNAPTAATLTPGAGIALTNGAGSITVAGSVFGASGASHASGDVPDPGSSAGTTRFLREDASWATPGGGGGGNVTSTGSISSLPGSPSSGDLYLPNDSPYFLRYDGSGWDYWLEGYECSVPPTIGSWTWVNQGTATTDAAGGALNITAPNTSGDDLRSLMQANPNGSGANVTITAVLGVAGFGSGYALGGLCIRNTNDSKYRGWGVGYDDSFRVLTSSDYQNWTTVFNLPQAALSSIVWLQIVIDSTNISYQWSPDKGLHWITIYQEAKAAYLSNGVDSIGFFAHCEGGQSYQASIATLFSWVAG